MPRNYFQTGDLQNATPYEGLQNLPEFLVGVPMTKGVNRTISASFTLGHIHAYGFRHSGWPGNGEPGIETIYQGTKYDDGIGNTIDTVVYKYFPDSSFTLSSTSYVWFFTRTPVAIARAILNTP